GPFAISPKASLTEGKLSLYALKTTSKTSFLKLGMYMALGRHVDMPEVHYEEATKGVVHTHPSVRVTIDGEVCANTPLHFHIAPDVLRVMAPLKFGE
ncbi:MAG TPA: hypothetical protein VK934_00620, partial [Fimbriimonas sp.]|nr:hypothetical protein [Fimbriimonas sp.]